MHLSKVFMLAVPSLILGQSAPHPTTTGVSNFTSNSITSPPVSTASTLQFTSGPWTNSTSITVPSSITSVESDGEITTPSASQASVTVLTSEIGHTSPSSLSNSTIAPDSFVSTTSSAETTASYTSQTSGTLLTSGITGNGFLSLSTSASVPSFESSATDVISTTSDGNTTIPLTPATSASLMASWNGTAATTITTTPFLPSFASQPSIIPALTITDGVTILTSPLPVVTGPPDGDIAPPRDDWLFWFISETESIFPIIEGWIDGSDREIGPDIQIHLDNLKVSLDGILPSLGPSKGTQCVASLFNLFECITDTIERISGQITGEVTDDLIKLIKIQKDDLKKRIVELKNEEYGRDGESTPSSSDGSSSSSSSIESSSSSSQSCTRSSTSEAKFTTCTVSLITSGTITTATEACQISTTTATGCSISASGSATTFSSSSSAPIASYCAWECEACNGKATVKNLADLAARSPERELDEPQSLGLATLSLRPQPLDDTAGFPGNAGRHEQHLDSVSLVRRTLDDPSAFEPDLDSLPDVDFEFSDGTQLKLVWPSGLEGYMLAYTHDKWDHPRTKVKHEGDETAAYSSSALRLFNEGEKVNVLLEGLWGCTSVIAVSRLGVYISHLWENPAFVGRKDKETEEILPRQFEMDVMYQVPNGGPRIIGLKGQARGEGKPFAIEGAETWAGLQDGNVVRTFIVTPQFPNPGNGITGERGQKPRPGELRYPADVERIRQALNEWVPNSNPEVVPYPADFMYEDELEPLLAMTSKGKVLFQYDPNERIDKEKKTVDGKEVECDVQKSKLRLMVENKPHPVYTDVWTSPTTGLFVPNAKPKDGAPPLDQRQALETPLACRTLMPSSIVTPSASKTDDSVTASSPDDTSTRMSTTPSSILTSSTNSTGDSATALSSSLTPTIVITASRTTSAASTPASSESKSFSFAPTTAPTALSSCGITSLPATTSDNVILGPKTYCTCNDDDWSVNIFVTTALNGATLSICTLGEASFTASLVSATTTAEPSPTTTGKTPPPPPTEDPWEPDYVPGVCNVHVREVVSMSWVESALVSIIVSDGAGNVKYESGEITVAWDDRISAPIDGSDLPVGVAVSPTGPGRELNMFESLDILHETRIKLWVNGLEWSSDDNDESKLPYCKVGGWDTGGMLAQSDDDEAFIGDTRDMDCHFEC